MAGGVSFLNAGVSVNGATKLDVTRWSASLSADVLTQYADHRKYPQQAAAVRHRAVLGVTYTNLGNITQGAGTYQIGTAFGAVVLTIVRNNPTGTVTYTQTPSVLIRSDASGGYGDLASLDVEYEAQGALGVEPTVTWAASA